MISFPPSRVDENINRQRHLLINKGFISATLHDQDQPGLFLSILRTRLLEILSESPNSRVSFTHHMPVSFENGRFPAKLTFNYHYSPNSKLLLLDSFRASLFDVSVNKQFPSHDYASMPSAPELLETLKNKLEKTLKPKKPRRRR